MTKLPCCCHYGAAVAGELPEFVCNSCFVHGEEWGNPMYTCKRHAGYFEEDEPIEKIQQAFDRGQG